MPKDVGHTIAFAILSIHEPKTRNVAARHQAARLDIPDLLTLVQAEFFRLQGHQKLWASSGQTLRTRFKSVLAGLGLPASHTQQHKALDLGSMRAGGATWLLETTENGNLVQRRGRWISEKVMSLYIQELSANIYLSQLSEKAKTKILKLAHAFPSLVQKAVDLHNAKSLKHLGIKSFLFTLARKSLMAEMGETGNFSMLLKWWHHVYLSF